MQTRQELETKLENVLENYKTLANSDPYQLREQIPSKDLWRFFITKSNQIKGRNLKLFFQYLEDNHIIDKLDQYRKKTVLEFICEIDKLPSADFQTLLDKSPTYNDMIKTGWALDYQQLQRLTIDNILQLDRGWIPYEINEPGYLESLYFAFDRIFDFAPLNLDHFQELHHLTTSNVKNTRYDSHPNQQQEKGLFRTINLNSLMIPLTCTPLGIKRLMDNQSNPLFENLSLVIEFDGCFFYPSDKNIQYIKTLAPEALTDPEILSKIFLTDKNKFSDYKAFKKALTLLTALNIENNLANYLYSLCEGNDFILRLAVKSKKIQAAFERLVHHFESLIQKASSPLDKLLIISDFTLSAAQLAPFFAANGRTITMILLNQLLMQNGLPPTILDNQNRFMGYSVDEIALEILNGMDNVFSLIKQKQLFGVSTDEISEYLERENLTDFSNYFNEITKLEDNFRVMRKDILQQIEALRSSDNPNLNNTSSFFQSSSSKRKASEEGLTQKEESSELKKKRG